MSSDAKTSAQHAEATASEPEPSGATDDGELPPRLASLLEDGAASASRHAEARAASSELPVGMLTLAQVVSVDDDKAELKLGASIVEARLVHVHPAVMRTACERGEPVLVQKQADGSWWVAGALRTQPTPGVDAMDEIRLDAKRITLRGSEHVELESTTESPLTGERTTARIALRAVGELETYATRILSKAEEVHKLIGRMLRIN
jgi:hypothetical protein